MIWFTSDTHFNHANIIPYERSQFSSIEEMNETLIKNWNDKVKPDDTIFHLGDVALGKFDDLEPIMERLNGNKLLTLGNHDRSRTRMLEIGFSCVERYIYYHHFNTTLWLAHIPSTFEDRHGRKYKRPEPTENYHIELCGHVHSEWRIRQSAGGKPIVNVGVDVWNLAPISFEEIRKELTIAGFPQW